MHMWRSRSELEEAIAEFKTNYERFAKKNKQFLLIDDEFNGAFQNAQVEQDIRKSARTFGDGIQTAMRTIEKKKLATKGNWTTRLGNFLTKLYPVARFCLSLVGPIAGVSLLNYSPF